MRRCEQACLPHCNTFYLCRSSDHNPETHTNNVSRPVHLTAKHSMQVFWPQSRLTKIMWTGLSTSMQHLLCASSDWRQSVEMHEWEQAHPPHCSTFHAYVLTIMWFIPPLCACGQHYSVCSLWKASPSSCPDIAICCSLCMIRLATSSWSGCKGPTQRDWVFMSNTQSLKKVVIIRVTQKSSNHRGLIHGVRWTTLHVSNHRVGEGGISQN